MTSHHILGYSKSVRAKCHGPIPCKNSAIVVGALRYGRVITSELGENVEWRHWGCVTPNILDEMARATVDNIVDFPKLRPSDQQKIRLAISLRRIDPSDIPPAARPRPGQVFKPVLAPKRKGEAPPRVSVLAPPNTQAAQRAEQGLEEEVPAEEDVREELYCVLNSNVVGIKHYRGLVGPGEQVLLVREPHNLYDKNAIQVKNISRIQVGHLPANLAVKLAPLLDRRAVTVEGTINDGNLGGSNAWHLSISVKFFAPPEKRAELEPQLIWATPGQRGFPPRPSAASSSSVIGGSRPALAPAPAASGIRRLPPGYAVGASGHQDAQAAAQRELVRKREEAIRKAAELRQMLDALEKVDDEGRRSSLLDTVCSKEDILNLPLHPNPPGFKAGDLKVDLIKHQSQALKWCIDRENPKLPQEETDAPVQFWQLRKSNNKIFYLNIVTKTPQTEPPPLGKGALLADAMGLGKTLTMLALILATKKDNHPKFSRSTLIVVPVSVLSNWEKQIGDHCTPGAMTYHVYHGNNRSISPEDLKKHDVVITTYQLVASEHNEATAVGAKKKKNSDRTLFEIPWKRIVLDEGHIIRNPKAKMAKAVIALYADRRWILTGTPIINSPRDLGSMLTFLKICQPLDNEDFFKRLLVRPLKNGEPEGAELLKALMSHICIRRTKEMQDSQGVPLIALPPVEMIRIPVALEPEARHLYNEVERASKQRVEKMMKSSTPAFIQSSVLSMLTRLRQISLHPGLVPARYLEELLAADAEVHVSQKVTSEEKLRLQHLLTQAIEDCEECPVCFEPLDDARITSCKHMFCVKCIIEAIERDPRCPMDRRPLGTGDLFERLPPTDLTQMPVRDFEEEAEGIRAGSSAKIDQLVQLLRIAPGGDKSLVFSQFTSFLDKVGETLEAEGIPFVRFDGQMSAKRRQEAIARFSVPVTKTGTAQIRQGKLKRATRRSAVSRASLPSTLDGEDSDDEYNPMNEDDEPDQVDWDAHDNPRVMLISLKAGALGLNLTVANHVYLMDPWWQEGIESQAVDRVNRIGQTKPVHVYQLITEATVESKVLDIQDRKKQLIKQAFAGIKSREAQRQHREARLQDLVELFGVRRQSQLSQDAADSSSQLV